MIPQFPVAFYQFPLKLPPPAGAFLKNTKKYLPLKLPQQAVAFQEITTNYHIISSRLLQGKEIAELYNSGCFRKSARAIPRQTYFEKRQNFSCLFSTNVVRYPSNNRRSSVKRWDEPMPTHPSC